MLSPVEFYILLSVLGAVLLSVPVAALCTGPRRRRAALSTAQEQPPQSDPVVTEPPPWHSSAEGGAVATLPADNPWTPPHAGLTGTIIPPPAQHSVWARIDIVFALVLTFVVALLMGPLSMGIAKEGIAPPKVEFTTTLFAVQLFFQVGMIGLVLGYLVAVRRFHPVTLFGLHRLSVSKTAGTAILWIIPSYFALIIVAVISNHLLTQWTGIELKQQMLVEQAEKITDPAARILMALTLCVGAPIMEEIIFRGVLFSVAAKYTTPLYANIASSLFFASVHSNLNSLIPLTMLGMVFAHVYHKKGSLAVPVLMHALFNGSQMLLLLLYGSKPQ